MFTRPPSTFHFAEGYTGNGFVEYLCLGNPTGTVATAARSFELNLQVHGKLL